MYYYSLQIKNGIQNKNKKQKKNKKIANRSFGNMEQLKYLGTTVTDQNSIQKEIKRRLNSGNACYHSVQDLLSSHLLSRYVRVGI
jgi:hypothetical protein